MKIVVLVLRKKPRSYANTIPKKKKTALKKKSKF